MRRLDRRITATAALVSLVALAGCNGPGSGATTGPAAKIPACDDIPQLVAARELYRDEPIYVANEMPVDAVVAWAQSRPGFQTAWIDREHHGWVTAAFTGDVTKIQKELATAFPDDGVVAVSVDWTVAQLEALQQRVTRDGQPFVKGSGVQPNHGVVSIYAGYLTPETLTAIESKFAGERVCLEGMDPADAPVEGPQPAEGDGWRLLADEDEVGRPYDTGIAADRAGLEALWADVGLAAGVPAVDFEHEVVIWFGQVHGSSCPRLRLDDVVVEDGFLFGEVTHFEEGACTADAIGHAYVVALERSKLPAMGFTIQLERGERPAGVVEDELTIVDADLSKPGATFKAAQLLSPPPVDTRPRIESGGTIETGYPWQYRLDVSCGIEWLGEVNDVWWRTRSGESTLVPPEWQAAVDEDGTVDLEITIRLEPALRLDALAGGGVIIYVPSTEAGRLCS